MEENKLIEAEAGEGVTPEILEIIFLKEIASRLADLQITIQSLNKNENKDKDKKIKPVPIERHVPYHVTRTLNAAEEKRERIAEDKIKGLRTVGRAGYIYNAGRGSVEIKIFDSKEWSDWMTIASGDGINFYYEDNIWLHTVRVRASKTESATYELAVNPGLE